MVRPGMAAKPQKVEVYNPTHQNFYLRTIDDTGHSVGKLRFTLECKCHFDKNWYEVNNINITFRNNFEFLHYNASKQMQKNNFNLHQIPFFCEFAFPSSPFNTWLFEVRFTIKITTQINDVNK